MLIAGRATLQPIFGAASAELACAELVGLRYVSDDRPGIRRRKVGKHFGYVAIDGRAIRDEETLRRIRALAIPPAYTDVWICADPRGHLQATGRDARGRKQYRYHPRWRDVRDAVKYHRMIRFGQALPTIRARVAADLSLPGLPREKVLAAVVRLLDQTHLRIGNEEYARKNDSFGLTTLQEDHVRVRGDQVRFTFRGKSGKVHSVGVTDRRLARVVRRCLEIPGCELFRYIDADGESRAIDSGDVNDYLRATSGDAFTAKDFRTWAGTVSAAELLAGCAPGATKRETKKQLVATFASVSQRLGNTPAVCKKSYVHPAVVDAFTEGWFHDVAMPAHTESSEHALRPTERLAIALLEAAERRPKPSLRKRLKESIVAAKRAVTKKAA